MRPLIKYISYSIGVFILILCFIPAFASASFPPEWQGASGFTINTGSEIGGDYTNTFHKDNDKHKIRTAKDGNDYDAIFSYKFAGKCSKVRILMGEYPNDSNEDYTAWAYYTDGIYTELGDFDGYDSHYYTFTIYFSLNPSKYLKKIKIEYSDTRGGYDPPDNIDIYVDWIQVYWTGIL